VLSQEYKDTVDELAKEARRRALELLKVTALNTNLKNMKLIIEANGGKLIDDVSDGAKYAYKGENSFEVYYDSRTASAKDLAHELGHHFLLNHLYKGSLPKGLVLRNIACSGTKEGNSSFFGDEYKIEYLYEMAVLYFERAFLLPKKEFIAAVDNYSNKDLCNTVKIAEIFGVSEHLVITRGDDLGLWERRNPRSVRRKVEAD